MDRMVCRLMVYYGLLSFLKVWMFPLGKDPPKVTYDA